MPSAAGRVTPDQLRCALGCAAAAQTTETLLSTDEGMAAARAAADSVDACDVVHVRSAEYVVAAADRRGLPVILRAGSHTNSDWHRQECQMAQALHSAGIPVCAPLTTVPVPVAAGVVSVWPYIPHDPQHLPAAVFEHAGRTLAALHEAGPTLTAAGHAGVFKGRGWRAPGKIGRRIITLAGRHPRHGALWLKGTHRTRTLAEAVLADPGPVGPVHGDYQPGNWLPDPSSDTVTVIDLATSGWGPALWDLTLLAGRCGPGRPYTAAHWQAFCSGYGCHPDVLHATAHQQLRTLSSAVAALTCSSAGDLSGHLDRFAQQLR